MKQVYISNHVMEMHELLANALINDYQLSSLPADTELITELRSKPADLIVLTISSSDTRSQRTYDIIKRIPEMEGKPVVFMMRQQEPELEKKLLSLGVVEVMVLPITKELLLHRIKNCLELSKLRHDRHYVEKYQDAISVSFAELVECRDFITGGHLKSTTRYFNILLQEALRDEHYKEIIPVEDVRDLLRSVMLHDIGKIGINDDILRKESSLDHIEYESMKTHTTLGKQAFERIINETGGAKWLYLARDLAYYHHERWDGSGYPSGLKGEEIPLYARMLTIADVYDALTSDRAYKKAYSHQQAMDIIMNGKGTLFDPDLVELFIRVSKQFEEALSIKNRNT